MRDALDRLLEAAGLNRRAGVRSDEVDALHRAVFEQAGDYVLLLEPDGDNLPRLVDGSDAAFAAHGYTREELVGKPLRVIDPDGQHDLAGDIPVLLAHKPVVFETRHRRKDGTRFEVEVRASLVHLRSRPIIVSVERDISHRKQIEARFKHSQALMSYIIAHARSAIAVHDRDLRYIYVSERYLRDYGVGQDVIGKHHYEVMPDLPQKWRDVHQRALRGEILSAEEDRWERADGESVWTRWECRPWYEDGGAIGGIIIYTEVITDRVLTEARLRRSERELRRSQEIAHLGRWTWTVASDQVEGSPEIEAILGVPCQGRRAQVLEAVLAALHPDDRSRARRALSTPGVNAAPGPVDYRVVVPGGVRYVLAYPCDRELDPAGSLVRLTGVVQDVTELRRTQEAARRLESQLHQAMKMEAVGRLAGGLAHDFNNLLTSILGNVSLALEDLGVSHPVAPMLDDVRKAGESAAALTHQLLAFSRKQVIAPRVLDLNEVVANVRSMLRRLLGEDIELFIEPGVGVAHIAADPGQLEQVLVNLAVNARDAMPRGGRLVMATRNAERTAADCAGRPGARPGRFVQLAVSDTGHGISDDVKAHLFEPFFTTKAKGHGTGLGLATCLGIVEQLGGAIEVESQVGRGTAFRLFFPAVELPTEQAGNPARSQRPSALAQLAQGHETVLLVEDDAEVRALALRILEGLGYVVLHARDGEAALTRAREHPSRIDLLLTDVVMPGMNGRELSERLLPLHPETKVLFASGYADDIIGRHGIVDGSLRFIAKPYTPQSLALKVREVLDRHVVMDPASASHGHEPPPSTHLDDP